MQRQVCYFKTAVCMSYNRVAPASACMALPWLLLIILMEMEQSGMYFSCSFSYMLYSQDKDDNQANKTILVTKDKSTIEKEEGGGLQNQKRYCLLEQDRGIQNNIESNINNTKKLQLVIRSLLKQITDIANGMITKPKKLVIVQNIRKLTA